MKNQWWNEKKGETLANAVHDYVKRLEQDQSGRQDANFRHLRLYGNLEASALKAYSFYRAEPGPATTNRVTLNIVQSMVDTVVSKLAKNKPKPTFLTEGGDWSLQQRAKKLTQFLEGQFQATNFYAKRQTALQASCIFGTGPMKIFREGKEIKAEPVFVDEIIVDDFESVYSEPRQLHQRKLVHIDVLKAAFPDKAKQIDQVCSKEVVSEYQSNSMVQSKEMIKVLESWHLRSGKDADDGLHTITIEGLELHSEPWNRDYFPFVNWKWNARPIGFFGQGLAEQLTGLQVEINKILRTIQVSMHLVSVPKLLVEASSKVVSAHLNNKIGGIIKYAGTPPEYAQLGAIPPELFAHLDRLYNRAYEIAGISQLSAQSQKPAGLDSGKAIREFNDIESERFFSVGQRDEDCVIMAGKIMIDEAKAIYEEYGEYTVKVSGGQSISHIKWDEVSMEEDQYVMRVFPTSALSSTPSGRLQDVQELIQAGFINKEDGMKLLDFPDLRQYYNFNNAGVEDIERTIELIIDKGDYQTPEPYQNLALGVVKMQQAYLMYKAQNAPESRLELFRRWIEDAHQLLKKAQGAVQQATNGMTPPEGADMPTMAADAMIAPPALPGAAEPIAVPEAPPTSELLPV